MKNKGNDDEYLNAIGDRIKKALEMQGLQQRDVLYLAKDKGYDIKQSTLSKICNGALPNPSIQTLAQIADIINLNLNDLLSLDLKAISAPVNSVSVKKYPDLSTPGDRFITSPDDFHMKGYLKNYHIYFFPTKSDEDDIIKGCLSFDRSDDNKKVIATLKFKTGKKDDTGKEIEKRYYGEMVISPFMTSVYCWLRNDEIGEICYIIFNYISLTYEGLFCRVAMVLTACAGDPRVPTAHRMIISVPEISEEDLEIIQGQLYMNSREILISELGMEELLKRKEIQENEGIKELLQKDGSNMSNIGLRPLTYYRFEESTIRRSFLDNESKLIAINLLRQYSSAPHYIKAGRKCDKFLYDFLQSRYGKER